MAILVATQSQPRRGRTAARRKADKSKAEDTPDKSPIPEASYVARIGLERNWIDTENGRMTFGPGMMVTAEIHTGCRRIIDYLLSPLSRKVGESMHER